MFRGVEKCVIRIISGRVMRRFIARNYRCPVGTGLAGDGNAGQALAWPTRTPKPGRYAEAQAITIRTPRSTGYAEQSEMFHVAPFVSLSGL